MLEDGLHGSCYATVHSTVEGASPFHFRINLKWREGREGGRERGGGREGGREGGGGGGEGGREGERGGREEGEEGDKRECVCGSIHHLVWVFLEEVREPFHITSFCSCMERSGAENPQTQQF